MNNEIKVTTLEGLRFAILDLRERAGVPMTNRDHNFWLMGTIGTFQLCGYITLAQAKILFADLMS